MIAWPAGWAIPMHRRRSSIASQRQPTQTVDIVAHPIQVHHLQTGAKGRHFELGCGQHQVVRRQGNSQVSTWPSKSKSQFAAAALKAILKRIHQLTGEALRIAETTSDQAGCENDTILSASHTVFVPSKTSEQIAWCAHHLVPGMFVGQIAEGDWRYPFVFRAPPLDRLLTDPPGPRPGRRSQ